MTEPANPYWAPTFDDGPHGRGQIGFICVANADLTEADMFRMRPPGVGVHFARIAMPRDCTVVGLAAMEDGLDTAVATLMPARSDLDVICYNCTSGSFVIGEDKIIDTIAAARPEVAATTLLTGVVVALNAVGARRIAIGTAYTDDINALEHTYFAEHGFDVVRLRGMGLMTDMEMNRVSTASLAEFTLALDGRDVDAVFISCGALRAVEIVDQVEAATGKPVITSNQASLWHCLRLAGIDDRIDGYGCLFCH
ncbi:MAG: arylmalonate decarboxylase [Alphaproteobacteria bacterium]|nr:arylmalonate decarboxylase [Alphaproteobacteria bacterium]